MKKGGQNLSKTLCATILSFVAAFFVSAFPATAAPPPPLVTTGPPCSPGIPCTGFDVNADDAVNDAKSGDTAKRCDGNLMNQIYARAFLEANRDYLLGMSMIRKPDSVLEYTCFDQFVGIVGAQAPKIFSETTDWQNHEILRNTADEPNDNPITINVVQPQGELTAMLDTLLMDALEEFIESPAAGNPNFGHTYIGGLSVFDNNLTYAVANAAYNCTDMQQVWNFAKCIDFGEEDQFWSFEHLTELDPRVLPDNPNPPFAECSPGFTPAGPIPSAAGGFGIAQTDPCPVPAAASDPNHDITNDIIRTAANCDFLYVIFDLLDMYYQMIRPPGNYPNSAVPIVNCADIKPIPSNVKVSTYTYVRKPTGPQNLLVVEKTGGVHDDKYCPNPSCTYNPAGNVCQ